MFISYIYIFILDLSSNSYKPFIKSIQNPSYIYVNSNHPKNIIKQIPKAVNLRIGKLSSNEKIFKESSKKYIDALKNSGFKEDFWGLKNKGLTPDIQWSILKRSSTPKSFDSRCNLCLEEKISVI